MYYLYCHFLCVFNLCQFSVCLLTDQWRDLGSSFTPPSICPSWTERRQPRVKCSCIFRLHKKCIIILCAWLSLGNREIVDVSMFGNQQSPFKCFIQKPSESRVVVIADPYRYSDTLHDTCWMLPGLLWEETVDRPLSCHWATATPCSQ